MAETLAGCSTPKMSTCGVCTIGLGGPFRYATTRARAVLAAHEGWYRARDLKPDNHGN